MPVFQTPSPLVSRLAVRGLAAAVLAAPIVALAVFAPAAQAQNPGLTARAFITSPLAAAMGGTGAAFATRETALFYNPAHLTRAAGLKPYVRIGLQTMGTTSILDQYEFYRDEIEPAIERGIDELTPAERDTLFDRTLRQGRNRTYAESDVGASAVMRVGGIGAGAGFYARTIVRYRTVSGGGGLPDIQASGVADLIATAAGAVDFGRFGFDGLSVGLTGKLTNRRVTAKDKPLDAFSENEAAYVFEGTSLGFDIGVTNDIDVPLPGRLTIGAVVYDVIATDFDYAYDGRRYQIAGDEQADEAVAIEEERALVNDDFALAPSYRVGVAYTAPSLFGILRETGVALDYQGYSDPLVPDRDAVMGLHAGIQVQVLRMLALRVGLAEGYTTGGVGLGLGPIKIDYAVHGQEDGRQAGTSPVWMHRLRVGIAL